MIVRPGQRVLGITRPGIWQSRGASSGPVAPSPYDKPGMVWGFDPRQGVTRAGSVVSAVADASGNGNHTTFAAGKEAEFVSGYVNGLPAIKLLSTTAGIIGIGAPVLFDTASPRGLYLLLQNTAEPGTYYHVFLALTTAALSTNFNFFFSNDPSYNLAFGVAPAAPATTFPSISGADITTAPTALGINYNGGGGSTSAAYQAFLNNAGQTIANGAGGNQNNTNANYVNSYGNLGPPVFPATDCYLIGAWLFDSEITPTERATIFKPFARDTYGIPQA